MYYISVFYLCRWIKMLPTFMIKVHMYVFVFGPFNVIIVLFLFLHGMQYSYTTYIQYIRICMQYSMWFHPLICLTSAYVEYAICPIFCVMPFVLYFCAIRLNRYDIVLYCWQGSVSVASFDMYISKNGVYCQFLFNANMHLEWNNLLFIPIWLPLWALNSVSSPALH
jgi:hypothetical protein